MSSTQQELFVRAERELLSEDLTTLRRKELGGWTPHTAIIEYDDSSVSSLSRLSAYGFVFCRPLPLQNFQGERQNHPFNYQLTAFGEAFIGYLDAKDGQQADPGSSLN